MSSDIEKPPQHKSSLTDFPPIEFAPLDVPLHRRRQTLAVIIYCSQIFICFGTFLVFCVLPFLWPLILVYFGYIYYDKSAVQGSLRSDWFRQLTFWNWVADFFPARIVAESSLDPAKNYIFGYHPHGILSLGANITFGTEGANITKLFPGLNIRLLTLASNFYIPLYREFLLRLNFASVSKESILNILGKGPGNSVAIVVGGAQESLCAKPEKVDLVLAKRYGFVKIAIQTGSSLVPVFAFGENNIFDQIIPSSGSILSRLQIYMKKITGFTFPLFHGRGVFNYNYGFIPKRLPLTVVVGKPIDVTKDENPSQETIQSVHCQYLEALKDLYDHNKDKYTVGITPPDMNFI